jgi:Holliday junction resolvase RusA-like endonuclease
MKLILPTPPSANRYWRTIVNKKTGRAMTFVSEEAKRYKRILAQSVPESSLLIGDICVSVEFYRAQRSGDLDNRLKCLFDALQGVVYANDSQIVEIHAKRFEDKERPRVEVEITPLGLL